MRVEHTGVVIADCMSFCNSRVIIAKIRTERPIKHSSAKAAWSLRV
jgi:hypothetical protein